jgi:hypothetical protein
MMEKWKFKTEAQILADTQAQKPLFPISPQVRVLIASSPRTGDVSRIPD